MSLTTPTAQHVNERRVRSAFTFPFCMIRTMCHGKKCLIPHHQCEQVKNNQMTVTDSRALPSTTCHLSCQCVPSVVCPKRRQCKYTGTVKVEMLKASAVSRELKHFMAFLSPSTALIFFQLFPPAATNL